MIGKAIHIYKIELNAALYILIMKILLQFSYKFPIMFSF